MNGLYFLAFAFLSLGLCLFLNWLLNFLSIKNKDREEV